eukprot:1189797-Prorocentrum_minimum.AAC.6
MSHGCGAHNDTPDVTRVQCTQHPRCHTGAVHTTPQMSKGCSAHNTPDVTRVQCTQHPRCHKGAVHTTPQMVGAWKIILVRLSRLAAGSQQLNN